MIRIVSPITVVVLCLVLLPPILLGQSIYCPVGCKGERGERGSKGVPGKPGLVGPPGPRGDDGRDGIPGVSGASGGSGSSVSLLVVHSQTSQVPVCPKGMNKLWTGYTLIQVDADGLTINHDLGLTSSCIHSFSTSLYHFSSLQVSSPGSCAPSTCSSPEARYYWMATPSTGLNQDSTPDVPASISRCIVCEAEISSFLVLHSQKQSSSEAECPENWKPIWSGYSFLMANPGDSEVVSSTFSSTGSCLPSSPEIRIIECRSSLYTAKENSEEGFCSWFKGDGKILYISSVEPRTGNHQYPNIQTPKISSCVVCIKDTKQNI